MALILSIEQSPPLALAFQSIRWQYTSRGIMQLREASVITEPDIVQPIKQRHNVAPL